MSYIVRYSRFRLSPDDPPSTAFPQGHTLNYPLVDLRLKIGDSTTPLLKMLIDSGSAYCIFGSDTAEALGINVRSGKLRQGIAGIGGGEVDLYFFSIELLIDSLRVDCYAGFMEQEFPGNEVYFGLLGEYDFLSKISVALDAKRLQIRIG